MASASEIFFGQQPSDVELDPERKKLREESAGARELLADIGSGRAESPAVAALRSEGQSQQEQARQSLRSSVAGTRGAGAQLLAKRAAQGLEARAVADIAGQTAQAVGQLTASEQAQARALGLSERQFAEQVARADDEERQRRARQGILNILTTGAGALAGGQIGGAQGAQVGGQLGQGVGRAFEAN